MINKRGNNSWGRRIYIYRIDVRY